MHLLSTLLFYTSLAPLIPSPKRNRGPSIPFPTRSLLAFTLLFLEMPVTSFFIITNNPTLHQASFAAMLLATSLVLLYRVERGDGGGDGDEKKREVKLRWLEAIGVL
jgi:hypothetical protein